MSAPLSSIFESLESLFFSCEIDYDVLKNPDCTGLWGVVKFDM